MLTRTFSNITIAGTTSYGDLTAKATNANQLLVFVTAVTGSQSPVVIRLGVDLQTKQVSSLKPILTSIGSKAGLISEPQGIAVNAQGMVLTALATRFTATCEPEVPNLFENSLVAFHETFPEDKSLPFFPFTNACGQPQVFNTSSIAADSQGNFYVGSDIIGSPHCGQNAAGALLFVPYTLHSFSCLIPGSLLAMIHQVAISPLDNSIYLINGTDVLHFPALQPPIATSQTITTGANQAVSISLSGSDPANKPLTFRIVTLPSHGTVGAVTGTPPQVTYTPQVGFVGTDMLTFVAQNETSDSAPATVTLTVTAAPSIPSPTQSTSGGGGCNLMVSDPFTPRHFLEALGNILLPILVLWIMRTGSRFRARR